MRNMEKQLRKTGIVWAVLGTTCFGFCRVSASPVSEQIIVDQFGWRASAARKVAIFADPRQGQNSNVSYVPGPTFELRRVSDNTTVFTGTVVPWRSGEVQTTSGDKVWWGDFSSFNTPGDYVIYDPT